METHQPVWTTYFDEPVRYAVKVAKMAGQKPEFLHRVMI
jgi:hypothetical protein